jgi:hypothetical protein
MPSLTDIPALKRDYREVGIGLAIAAGLALIIAAFTPGWLRSPYGDGTHLGLISATLCANPDRCERMSNFALVSKLNERTEQDTIVMERMDRHNELRSYEPEEPSGAFAPMGLVALISAAVGGLSLFLMAFLAIKRKKVESPIQPAQVALLSILLSLITGCAFIATKPGGDRGIGVGYSFWIFGVSAVVGIVGAQILNKLIKPPDKAWTA